MGAGKNFVPFTIEEIKKFFGLFILHRLSPLPQIIQKFKPQSSNPVNRNNLIFTTFGKNAEHQMKEFKCYFTVADPIVQPPSKKVCSNWKVQEFLSFLNQINQYAWISSKLINELTQNIKLILLLQVPIEV
jgi:hypothetical protein